MVVSMMMETKKLWVNSPWFKEWERLAYQDYLGYKGGYWYYDNFKKMYIYEKREF